MRQLTLLILTASILILYCGAADASRFSVNVSNPSTIVSGTQTTLDNLYVINHDTYTMCTVVYNHQGNYPCGIVSPLTLPCNYSHLFTFQHYGCLAVYETLNFQVEVLTNNSELLVEGFSILLHVLPNPSLPRLLTKQVASNTTLAAVSCPTESSCSYSIRKNILPYEQTAVTGFINHPIPCGNTPQFLYNSFETSAIIVSIACLNKPTTYYILPTTISKMIRQVPPVHYQIEEMMETPIPSWLLPIDDLLRQHEYLEFVFPVESTGGFYSQLTSAKNLLNVTTFTSKDLQEERVTFKPNEKSIAAYFTYNAQFHYYVLSWTGQAIAEGIVHLKISPRTGTKPSIRKNVGIVVRNGGRALITTHQFNFYPPKTCCNYTITILKSPRLGSLIAANGNPLNVNDTAVVSLNNLTIQYHHRNNSFNTGMFDSTKWLIQCSDMKQPLVAVIPIKITSQSTSSIRYCNISVMSAPGSAFLLSAHSPCNLPTLSNVSVIEQPHKGRLFYWPTACTMENNSHPFIHQADLPTCVQRTLPAFTQWSNIWYITNISETLRLTLLHQSTITTIFIDVHVTMDDIKYSQILFNQSIHSIPAAPFVERNLPITLSTADPIYITSNFLYVRSQGYLHQDVIYDLVSLPLNGIICLLYDTECYKSITSFTQQELIANKIYYKPIKPISKLKNDSLTFQVLYPNRMKIPGVHTLAINHFEKHKEGPLPVSEFWVNSKSKKVIRKKHLIHFKEYFGSGRLRFEILKGPRYGVLKTSKKGEFTWKELSNKMIIYENNETSCSDEILFRVTDEKKNSAITANFTIAIRHTRSLLSVNIKGRKLQDEDAFTLSPSDFNLSSGFCYEFVKFFVLSMPTYGFLQITDSSTNVTRHIQANGTFTANDLQEGRVMYQTYPALIFVHNTQDAFEIDVHDPRSIDKPNRVTRSISSNIYQIFINTIANSTLAFNFTTSGSKRVSDVGRSNYSTVFNSNDMYLSPNSDFVPSEVFINIDGNFRPRYGQLQRAGFPTNTFTLRDIYDGKISYIVSQNAINLSITSDTFRFYVTVKINGNQWRVEVESKVFALQWCYFKITATSNVKDPYALVQETSPQVNFTISRVGAYAEYPAEVNLVTEEQKNDQAAVGADCTNGTTTDQLGDFCMTNASLYFHPNQTKLTTSVIIIDNDIPQGNQLFKVKLENPQNCLVHMLHSSMEVFVVDYEDYASIGFQREGTSNCMTVPEDTDKINITLVRTGYLNQTDGIICYTHQNSNDYVTRPNNYTSLVYFEPGQKYANCTVEIINDGLYEGQELFFVRMGQTIGHSHADNSEACVFIAYDNLDAPLVFFQNITLVFKENRNQNTRYNFTIKRYGVDLDIETNVEYAILPGGNATAGLDYDPSSLLETRFAPGQVEAYGEILILHDNIKEGNESFDIVMRTPQNGRIEADDKLKITIVDSTGDMFIGFTSSVYHFNETDSLIQLPIYRRGDTSVKTNVTCVLTAGTADSSDFFLYNSTEIFPINSTSQACSIVIINDRIREGDEEFFVTLMSRDPYVTIDSIGRAKVIITDIEDATQIQFKDSTIYIQEPLSNYPVDLRSVVVTVRRYGDLKLNTSILYYWSSNDVSHHGTVSFLEGTNETDILIPISADHTNHNDKMFRVHLQTSSKLDVILGPINETLIIVQNTFLTGVFFPAEPKIQSYFEDSYMSNDTNGTVYHNLPLICITPCDMLYELPDNENYVKECTTQAIDNSKTIYKWHVSYDGVKYNQLDLDTLYTNTHSQILEPVYLSDNIWIKCKVTAVDDSGVKGYARTSIPVFLKHEFDDCDYNAVTSVMFTSYPSFKGSNMDFVKLSITLPIVPNTVPVITTQVTDYPMVSILTHSGLRKNFTCSSFISNDRFNFITADQGVSSLNHRSVNSHLLYKHHSLITCSWNFDIWLSLKTLTDECGAATLSLQPLSLSLPLFVSYISIANGTVVVKNQSTHTAHLIDDISHQREPKIMLPFEYYPDGNVPNTAAVYFSPHVFERLNETRQLLVIGYFNSEIYHVTSVKEKGTFDSSAYQVYTKAPNQTGWAIEVDDQKEVVSLVATSCHNTVPLESFCVNSTFDIPVTQTAGRIRMGLSLESSAANIVNVSDLSNRYNFEGQFALQLNVHLHRSFVLKSHFTLVMSDVKICRVSSSNVNRMTTREGRCNGVDVEETVTLMDQMQAFVSNEVDREKNSNLTVYFVLDDSLSNNLLNFTQRNIWYVDANCVIQTTNDVNVSNGNIVTRLNYPAITDTPTIVNEIDHQEDVPSYVTTLFVVTLIMLLAMCGFVLTTLAYTTKKKWMSRKNQRIASPEEGRINYSQPVIRVETKRRRKSQYSRQPYIPKISYVSPPLPTPSTSSSSSSSSAASISSEDTGELRKSKSLPDLSKICLDVQEDVASSLNISIDSMNEHQSSPTNRDISIMTMDSLSTTGTAFNKDYSHIFKSPNNHSTILSLIKSYRPSTYQPQGVGWYERCHMRQKSLESYAQLYQIKSPEHQHQELS